MNFHCERCDREVPIERFHVEGGALVGVCPACGAEGRADGPSRPRPLTVIEGGGRPSVEESLLVPARHCPKCVAPRGPEALACPRCGLVFANANPAELAPSPQLKARWATVVERWSDPGEHERLMRHAASLGELVPLARLYRIWSVRQPKDGTAKKALEGIVALVSAASLVPSKRVDRRTRVLIRILVALIVFTLLGLIGGLWVKYGRAR